MQDEKNGSLLVTRPALLFFLPIPALLFIFRFLLNFNGLYGQDSHEYLHYARQLHDFFKGGPIPGAFHWPWLYPFLGAVLSFVMSADFGLQLLSITGLCSTLYFVYKSLLLSSDDKKNALLFVFIFGLCSSYFLRLGVVVMSDTPAICCISASLYFILSYYHFSQPRYVAAALLFAMAAFFMRYASAIILLLPLAFLIGAIFTKKDHKTLLVPGVILVALLYYLYNSWHSYSAELRSYMDGWAFTNFFKNDFTSAASGVQVYRFPNVLFAFSLFVNPGFVLPGLALIFFIRRSDIDVTFTVLFFSILFYLFFLAGFPLQNTRLLTLAFPLLLILYYPIHLKLQRKLNSVSLKQFLVAGILAVQAALFYFAFDDFIITNRLERAITSSVKEKRPGTPVFTLGMEGPLMSYCPDREVISFTRYLNLIPQPAMVLVNPLMMETQWQGTKALELWKLMEPNCKSVEKFEKGWELYEYR